MHILLTGGTGLMGRRLCARWRQAGHRLTVFSRRPQQVESLCGVGVRGIDRFDEYGDQPLDAVVNLAGEPIADKPWSHKRKALLWESRVRLTERLVEWLDAREQRPDLLLSGSAVGWYGDSGERPVTEEGAAAGEDFASELCLAWEQIALEAGEARHPCRAVAHRPGAGPRGRLPRAPVAALPARPGRTAG